MAIKIVLTIVFSAGITAILWFVIGKLLTPVGSEVERAFAILCVEGSTPCLQRTTDGLLWMIDSGRLELNIVIADLGMDEETRKMAELIAERDMRVILCEGKDLAEICLKTDL